MPNFPPRTNSNANTALVLGVVGLLFGWCSVFVPNVIAIIIGRQALREVRLTGEQGRTAALVGIWLAVAPIGLLLMSLLLAVANK